MITTPLVTRFSNEVMRPCADALEQAAQAADTLLALWDARQVESAMKDAAGEDVVDDRATEEGRPVYTKQYMLNFIQNVRGIKAILDKPLDGAPEWNLRMQLTAMATNIRNPLAR